MWLKWMPWRYVVSRVAKSHGFLDPIALLSKLHRFAQPSEVTEPIELLRAGVVFHARGLINARTIQHNLDWVWPYWVERQFDPQDKAFIPRAFSITHVNLTHRNWTAVGLPDCEDLPIVDPRGLVTPLWDGWSLDAWLVRDDHQALYPSRSETAEQHLHLLPHLAVETRVANRLGAVRTVVDMIADERQQPYCRLRASATSPHAGWLVIALRPTNPEGVSFVHQVRFLDEPCRWLVEDEAQVMFDRHPDRMRMSCYHDADVAIQLPDGPDRSEQTCDVGLATAAALYRVEAGGETEVTVSVPLAPAAAADGQPPSASQIAALPAFDWTDTIAGTCQLQTPDPQVNRLFTAAATNLILHTPGDVFPGPYTYKRFWFRDAAFLLHGLLVLNQFDRVERALDRYPDLQTAFGYFHSQDGEWDSNGAALWILNQYRRLSGRRLSDRLLHAVEKGAKWIEHKRLDDSLDKPHAGLMPAGFSAEHLGPNDFYYWDDFWSAAGLRAAAEVLRDARQTDHRAGRWEQVAVDLLKAVERSLDQSAARRDREGIPASCYRRLDAGAIGSICCSYPLQLTEPDDARVLATVDFLLDRCSVDGGFFQDMIHSGINAYLTLHLAQVLLRSGTDTGGRYVDLLHAVRDLASPTGQWPEAIHPHTHGGCMGDGQHLWAAAEWVLMVRNMFVREEGDTLVLASGLPRTWLESGEPLRLGPTATAWGPVTVEVESLGTKASVRWSADWRHSPLQVVVWLPGTTPRTVDPSAGGIEVALGDAASTTS